MEQDDAILTADEINNDIYPDLAKRFGAVLLDGLFLLVFFVLFTWLEGYGKTLQIYTTVLHIMILVVYHIYLVQKYSGTPGKIMLSIKIIKLDTRPITWKEAALRYAVPLFFIITSSIWTIYLLTQADNAHYISLGWRERAVYLSSLQPVFLKPLTIMPLSSMWTLGEIIAVFASKRKRALHDYIAGTVVVVANYPDDLYEDVDPTTAV
jgi:uncharacterized RDD family membrane protein YckC